MTQTNIYQTSVFKSNGNSYRYFPLNQLESALITPLSHMPYCIRVLLEGALRAGDDDAVGKLSSWQAETDTARSSINYQPARVLLQDLTGVPVIVDLASLRSAMARRGFPPRSINPLVPVDLVIDHSLQVDVSAQPDASQQNLRLEYQRNQERYSLLKWAQNSFDRLRIVPPGSGIVHQVNLEFLATVVMTGSSDSPDLVYPDTVIGTDSHTTMINGLGVLGWGVGGIEAIAAMLKQPVEVLLPDVVGIRLTGQLPAGSLPTDIVLTLTHRLRKLGVVNKFVEFYGPALTQLSVQDRAMLANMAPEYGATCGFFPVDQQTLDYLTNTGRDSQHVNLVRDYYQAQGMFRDENSPEPVYTEVLEFNLSEILPAIAGPKRPQDLVLLTDAANGFIEALTKSTSERGYGLSPAVLDTGAKISIKNTTHALTHGAVVLAAITSCTNTSNPTALIAAGLLAKNAVLAGLKVPAYVKTSFAPGSRVVVDYLSQSGLQEYLDDLGFQVVGLGCTTCIGNSGPLPVEVASAIEKNKLITAAVISGNRNFEGRVHPLVQANYLASPALVVAYTIAASMRINLAEEPLGIGADGKQIFLADIWPDAKEVEEIYRQTQSADMYQKNYSKIFQGDENWQSISTPVGDLYPWDSKSTYIKETTFCEPTSPIPSSFKARPLALFGDSITTDHISPAGTISKGTPAAKYLDEHGILAHEYNTYGTRRGNHEVMERGTFANIRIKNLLVPGVEGGFTIHYPDAIQMTIFEASRAYEIENIPLIILAGKEYGTGSSRDWAAKGPRMLGIQAVIAESFERIHRSNLIGMGILPLQFMPGENIASLGLIGEEEYTFYDLHDITPGAKVRITAQSADRFVQFRARALINSAYELDCWKAQGIFQLFARGDTSS